MLLILLVGYAIWSNLPVQIQRSGEIEKGNHLISGLQVYQEKYGTLPETGDWQALEKAGFEIQEMGTVPEYQKVSDSTFSLTYLKGFDGPYLTYESTKGDWTIE